MPAPGSRSSESPSARANTPGSSSPARCGWPTAARRRSGWPCAATTPSSAGSSTEACNRWAAQRKAGCRFAAPGFLLYGPQRGPSHGDQRRQRYAFIPTAGPGRTKNRPPPIRRTATRTPAQIPATNPGRSRVRARTARQIRRQTRTPGHRGTGTGTKKTGRTLFKVRPVRLSARGRTAVTSCRPCRLRALPVRQAARTSSRRARTPW